MSSNIIKINTGTSELRSIWKGDHLWISCSDITTLIGLSDKNNTLRYMTNHQLPKADLGGPRTEHVVPDIDAIIYISKSKSFNESAEAKHRAICAIVKAREAQLKTNEPFSSERLRDAISVYNMIRPIFEEKNSSQSDIEKKSHSYVTEKTGIDLKEIYE